ncbi:NADPH:quinone oxidoreductase family protein [Marinobacter zhanjiangensis]|uniref:Oxidoreductase n=1 Tax=Marinobacter zhanjiangensis TaxID=578215 RepID=A0ABQ3B511_9GAMM|nr:NADPH:quinone oxidoreductase family protein [Marinobacter zhanjiangensis]GGY75485.1 oxidoreductase [Marinobacter zhanjiangensis]
MRAILCKEYGPAEKLVIEDIECPEPTGGQVKVRVKAAGLNFPDTLIIEGKYQIKPEMPFSPGGEMAGEVIAVGDKVSRFKVGDRVIGMTGYGAFSEEMLVDENRLLPLAEGMSDEEGAAFTMVYGTSYHALKQRANIQPGESLLVLGASGGVGLAAVELGKAMGAHVIAAASTDAKLQVAKEAGADELLNYSDTDKPLKDKIKEMTGGKGVDVIYDPVGGDFTEQALRAMAWNGRHLIIGFAAGDIPKIPANLTLLKSCSVVGVFWGAFTQKEPQNHVQNMKELFQLHAEGKIKPKVSEVFAFEDYVKALDALSGRTATGKVVLKVSD